MGTTEKWIDDTPFDVLADFYDLLTANQRYAPWIEAILSLARDHGLPGRRVLDVACGTGKSFLPLIDHGFDVTACDVSSRMVAVARAKCAGGARVCVADMRDLPQLGRFDLVTCLNDALNHLLTPAEVAAALAGMRRNLADGGLLVFDVNTVLAYATGRDAVVEEPGRLVVWRGSEAVLPAPGGCAEMVAEVFTDLGDGRWRREQWRHSHRHYSLERLEELIADAGLELCAVRGQLPGGRLEGAPDPSRHHKALFVARRACRRSRSREEAE